MMFSIAQKCLSMRPSQSVVCKMAQVHKLQACNNWLVMAACKPYSQIIREASVKEKKALKFNTVKKPDFESAQVEQRQRPRQDQAKIETKNDFINQCKLVQQTILAERTSGKDDSLKLDIIWSEYQPLLDVDHLGKEFKEKFSEDRHEICNEMDQLNYLVINELL